VTFIAIGYDQSERTLEALYTMLTELVGPFSGMEGIPQKFVIELQRESLAPYNVFEDHFSPILLHFAQQVCREMKAMDPELRTTYITQAPDADADTMDMSCPVNEEEFPFSYLLYSYNKESFLKYDIRKLNGDKTKDLWTTYSRTCLPLASGIYNNALGDTKNTLMRVIEYIPKGRSKDIFSEISFLRCGIKNFIGNVSSGAVLSSFDGFDFEAHEEELAYHFSVMKKVLDTSSN